MGQVLALTMISKPSDDSDISSDDTNSVHFEVDIVERALQWQEDHWEVLEELVVGIANALDDGTFDSDENRVEMRMACEELLARKCMPVLYRAQLLCTWLAAKMTTTSRR